jgi:valyl-tRNA synthetase
VAEGRAGRRHRRRVGQHRAYPQAQPEKIDAGAIAWMERLRPWSTAAATARRDERVARDALPLYAVGDAGFMREAAPVLQALAKLSEVQVFDDEAAWAAAAKAAPVAVVGDARLCLFMEIDVAAEKARIAKEAARLEGELAKANGKLANQAFVAKAPPAVIEQERKRIADFTATLERICGTLVRLG